MQKKFFALLIAVLALNAYAIANEDVASSESTEATTEKEVASNDECCDNH